MEDAEVNEFFGRFGRRKKYAKGEGSFTGSI